METHEIAARWSHACVQRGRPTDQRTSEACRITLAWQPPTSLRNPSKNVGNTQTRGLMAAYARTTQLRNRPRNVRTTSTNVRMATPNASAQSEKSWKHMRTWRDGRMHASNTAAKWTRELPKHVGLRLHGSPQRTCAIREKKLETRKHVA